MAIQLQFKRGNLASLPSLADGEPALTTDINRFYLGDSGNVPMACRMNLAATGAPTVNDDAGDGYSVNSIWTDVTNDNSYILQDSTVGAAVWQLIDSGAGVPTTITVANEATDTTCFPLFVTAATGDLGPKTVASFTLNSNTGALGITTIELGHASDTTIARSGAGDITIEGNAVYRAGGTDVPLADIESRARPFQNFLMHGDFGSYWIDTSQVITTEPYIMAAHWRALRQTSGRATHSQEAGTDGNTWSYRMAVTSSAVDARTGTYTMVFGEDAISLRSRSIIGQARVYANRNSGSGDIDVRMALIEFTGTVDAAINTDFVADWTSTDYTFGASKFFLNDANYSVLSTAAATVPHGTWATLSTTGTVGASANNLFLFIWLEDAPNAVGDFVDICKAGLFDGSQLRDWLPVTIYAKNSQAGYHTGTWIGSPVDVTYGGTGANLSATGPGLCHQASVGSAVTVTLPSGFSAVTPADGDTIIFSDTSASEAIKKCTINTLGDYVVPVGTVMMFTGTLPSGWLECDGTAVSRTTYADLYAVTGDSFGDGNSTTTFNVPDFRGRVPMGLGTGTGGGSSDTDGGSEPSGGSALTARSMGEWLGAETHALSSAENASHTHGPGTGDVFYTRTLGTGNWTNAAAGTTWNNTASATASSGSGTAHNNIQPVMCLRFMIKY